MKKFHICPLYKHCQNKECSHYVSHDKKKDCNSICHNSNLAEELKTNCIEVKYK